MCIRDSSLSESISEIPSQERFAVGGRSSVAAITLGPPRREARPSEQVATVSARAAESEGAAGTHAVGAPLLAKVAGVARAALVDGVVAAAGGGDRCGSIRLVPSPPGHLLARGRAEGLAADAAERGAADGAGQDRGGCRLIIVSHGAHLASPGGWWAAIRASRAAASPLRRAWRMPSPRPSCSSSGVT